MSLGIAMQNWIATSVLRPALFSPTAQSWYLTSTTLRKMASKTQMSTLLETTFPFVLNG
jgi:hypothetical protein